MFDTNLKNIKTYIASAEKMGANEEEIKSKLKKAGFKEELIEKAYSKPKEEINKIKKTEKKQKINKFHEFKPTIIVASLMILTFIIVMIFFNINTCDQACFIKKANNCEASSYNSQLDNITMQLETYNNCSIKKTIIGLDETEPMEIQELFLNKSMICNYEKNNFPEELVTSLSNNIDSCKGDLKDNILIVLSLIE